MKKFLLLCCLGLLASCCLGQTPKQLEQCKEAIDKDSETILSTEICPLVVAGLTSTERVISVDDGGLFMTLTPDGALHQHSLSPKIQSSLLLKSLSETIVEAEKCSMKNPRTLTSAVLRDARDFWLQVRDAYCSYHPGEIYSDLSDKERVCADAKVTGDPETFPERIVRGATTLRLNLSQCRLNEMETGGQP